jgi:hypothetical protein
LWFVVCTKKHQTAKEERMSKEARNDNFLRAVTKVTTNTGDGQWEATSIARGDDDMVCLHSYAHGRISQLLLLKYLASLVGDETLGKAVRLRNEFRPDKKMSKCIEEEALAIAALEAGVVVKGLTGMVTVDDNNCFDFEGETEICRNGTTASYSPSQGQSTDAPSAAAITVAWSWLHPVVMMIFPVVGLLVDWL